MFSPLPTHLHGWIASIHYHPSDGVFVLHVVTRGEYESWCRDLGAVVPLAVGVCIRPGQRRRFNHVNDATALGVFELPRSFVFLSGNFQIVHRNRLSDRLGRSR